LHKHVLSVLWYDQLVATTIPAVHQQSRQWCQWCSKTTTFHLPAGDTG